MITPRVIWTNNRETELRRLAALNWSNDAIAVRLGTTPLAVKAKRARLKLQSAPVVRPPRQDMGRWARSEEVVALRMDRQGFGPEEIATALPGRTPLGVKRKLRLLRGPGSAPAPAVPVAPVVPVWTDGAEQAGLAPVVQPTLPKRVRRVEALFDVTPPVARSVARPRPGSDVRPGSVLAGVPIHPAHVAGGRRA